MSNASLVFDHVHLVGKDPESSAAWYEEKLGGRVVNRSEVRGAPSLVLSFTVDPMDFGPTARIAFIEAPDGVSIELVHRKG